MKKRILFSPVGGTDPIRNNRDGSMLHICRHYRPDIVILYLSQEMLINHRRDNRYVDALTRLEKRINHKFDIFIIERPELVDVQQYDVFYRDFRNIIREIETRKSIGDELLINTASGTPAMKSALLVMATLAEYRFNPIQVSTPLKKINIDNSDYDNEGNWNNNIDNTDLKDNRCEEIQCMNLVKLLKIDIIKNHINAYDYPAALSLAQELKDDISKTALRLIQIADARVKLNRNEVKMLNQDYQFPIYPIHDIKKQKIFEYALVLQIQVIKEEYADFIRGITPIVVDLLEEILERKYNIRVADYCNINNNVMRWNFKKLKRAEFWPILCERYGGNFKLGPVYSTHMIAILHGISKDTELLDNLKKIEKIESKVRNVAAHEIVSVTDTWFKQKTGNSVSEILDILKYLINKADISTNIDDWDSYNKMNRMIINELK